MWTTCDNLNEIYIQMERLFFITGRNMEFLLTLAYPRQDTPAGEG